MGTVRTLAGSIRERRRSTGLTLSQLGRDTGIDLATLSNIEAGRRGLSLTSALLIARRLGCAVEDITALDDENHLTAARAPILAWASS